MDNTAQLFDTLVRWNIAYREGNPIVSDPAYDALERQGRLLVPDHPFFDKIEDDVVQPYVGGNYLAEVAHESDMGSQDKAMSVEDPGLKSFFKRIGGNDVFFSEKEDGLSAVATYVEGPLTQALTRGDGKVGVDITDSFVMISGVPKWILCRVKVHIRGEIMLKKDRLPIVNAELIAESRDKMANTRNAAVGIIKTAKNRHLCKYLSFIAYNITLG